MRVASLRGFSAIGVLLALGGDLSLVLPGPPDSQEISRDIQARTPGVADPGPFLIALSVEDVRVSVKWYVEMLGFRILFPVRDSQEGELHATLERNGVFLDLISRPSPATGAPPPDKMHGTGLPRGVYRFGLAVADLQDIIDRVQERNGRPRTGVDGGWGIRWCELADPDGNRIWAIQRMFSAPIPSEAGRAAPGEMPETSGGRRGVVLWQGYDWWSLAPSTGMGSFGVDDGGFPIEAEAEAGAEVRDQTVARTLAGDGKRLTLLLVHGAQIRRPSDVPIPRPHSLWTCVQGSCHVVKTTPDAALQLEVADRATFRLSLVDEMGQLAETGRFRVHRCERFDHESPIPPVPAYSRSCSLPPQDSTAGAVAELIVNPHGSGAADSRGYLGIELLKVPQEPGMYFVRIDSLDKTYRLRDTTALALGESRDSLYSGAWSFCVVPGSQILNEEMKPVTKTLNLSINRGIYIREVNPPESSDSYAVDLIIRDQDSGEEARLPITLWRLGRTPMFRSLLVTVITPDEPLTPETKQWNENVATKTMPSLLFAPSAGQLKPGPGVKEIRIERPALGAVPSKSRK
jgi:catechol 2,3-dioxygenase-like lactoylglutathione lyase family enzyme